MAALDERLSRRIESAAKEAAGVFSGAREGVTFWSVVLRRAAFMLEENTRGRVGARAPRSRTEAPRLEEPEAPKSALKVAYRDPVFS